MRPRTIARRSPPPKGLTGVVDEYLPLADRGTFYRGLAAVIRARIPHLQSVEARLELASLALDYENLATYVETHLARAGAGAERGQQSPSLRAQE
jgi:hypothetical protein